MVLKISGCFSSGISLCRQRVSVSWFILYKIKTDIMIKTMQRNTKSLLAVVLRNGPQTGNDEFSFTIAETI